MNKVGKIIMAYTKEFLISELQRFYNENGKVPGALDMNTKAGYPYASAYQYHFNSWNNALIEADFEINQKHREIDGTETCSYCGKRADEIPNFGCWRYPGDVRYCNQHGQHGIADYVMGDLDINSSKGLGRAGEILVAKTLKIPEEYDCNRKSCHAPTDMYHENYGKIDVKTALFSITRNTWRFKFKAKQESDTYFCVGLSSNRSNVKHVWIVLNKGKIKNLQTFGVYDTYRSLLNRSHWEVDAKPYNDIWKTMKLDNCKIMTDKSKSDYIKLVK